MPLLSGEACDLTIVPERDSLGFDTEFEYHYSVQVRALTVTDNHVFYPET